VSKIIASRTPALTETPFHYCPGCAHGIIHRLTAEVIDELGLQEKTIGIASVGCSVFSYDYFNVDMLQAAHGRAPAVATGVKRVHPQATVFSYQGDGDLAAIGTAEIVHAAARGEKITVIFVNNTTYGMTGGQQAPTTLLGQVTKTTPYGRTIDANGYPINVSELLSTLDGAVYVARTAVFDPVNVAKTKKAIKKAFEVQEKGLGFSLVEVLANCPTNWHLSPQASLDWLKENMLPRYPLGEFRVPEEVK
jgi:2-oxoglutarate ferredoxin oxidoreductase subunit beta